MTVTLHGADSLGVGRIGGGQRVVKRLRLRGEPGFDAKLKVRGAHADRLTVVANRETLDGAGPHELTARGRRIDLGLILEAPTDAGPIDCALTLGWADGDAKAAFEGEVVVFEVDRESADYGEVLVGETAQRVVTIRNRCVDAIDVELRAPASPFACALAGTQTIDAHGQLPVPVDLSPTAAGPADATLKVALGTQLHSVALTGEGRDPFEEAADVSETGDGEATGSEQHSGGPTIGDFQRLYLHVPTKNTNVTLGKEYDADPHDPTHAGFSATTDGHVLLRNRVAEQTMTFQSTGQQWYQSTTKDVFLGAGEGGFHFIAGGGAYLSSGKGILIAAGHGDLGEMNEFDSGKDPPVPAIASIGDALKGVQDGWKVAGFMMSAFGLAYTSARLALVVKNKTFGPGKWREPLSAFLAAPIAGLVKNATMTSLSVADTINKEAELNQDPILPTQGINMYAEGGFLSGTMGFCSVYGATGASFRSLNAGVLGLVNASLDSLVATGMYGFRSAGLSSLSSVSIGSGYKTLIGTPNGTLDIKGTQITATTKAGMLVKGAGVNFAAPTMDTKAGPILGLQGKQVQASGATVAFIEVANKYGIEITPTGLKVGNLLGKTIMSTSPHLMIDPTGVTVIGGPAGPVQLKITPAGVTMQGPGNDLRHMGMTLFSRATRVELC